MSLEEFNCPKCGELGEITEESHHMCKPAILKCTNENCGLSYLADPSEKYRRMF